MSAADENPGAVAMPDKPVQRGRRCKARSKRHSGPCGAFAVTGWAVCRFHGAHGGAPRGNRNGERHGLYASHKELTRKIRQAKAANKAKLEQPTGAMELTREAVAFIQAVVDNAVERNPHILEAIPGSPEFEALAKHEKDLANLGLMLERTQTETTARTTPQSTLIQIMQASSDGLTVCSVRGIDGGALTAWQRPDGTYLLEAPDGSLRPAIVTERPELGCVMYSLPPHDSTANEGDT